MRRNTKISSKPQSVILLFDDEEAAHRTNVAVEAVTGPAASAAALMNRQKTSK
jgi:hypothetical protein